MAFIEFNSQPVIKVTAPSTSADNLAITIGDKTYSESFDTDAATTIDNFVVSHGSALNQISVLAVDSATTLDLYGVGGRTFKSDNSFAISSELIVKPADVANVRDIDSANQLELTLAVGGTNTSTVTVTYFDTESRDIDKPRLLQHIALGRDAIVRPSSATKSA